MKANEMPERIYLFDYNDAMVTPLEGDTVYVREDAFIEKACEWLRTHSEADYFELIPDANYCGAGNLNKKRMIEEFRKYMEE